jgi:hypothetical protein
MGRKKQRLSWSATTSRRAWSPRPRSGSSSPRQLAPRPVAGGRPALGTELVPTEHRTFASGEILTRFEVSIRGCDLHHPVLRPPVNEWLMELLIMLDAAKRASAKRITVVAPYYPYSRQDKKGRGREPIGASRRRPAQDGGADRVMSVDLHAAQIQGFFDGPVDHLFAKPVLLEYFQNSLRPTTAPSSPSSRPTPGACASPTSGPTRSTRRSRSSTSAATRTSPTR